MKAQKKNPLSEVNLAGDSEQGAGGVSGVPARITRYEKARSRALVMRSFAAETGHVKEAGRLAKCGEYLLFRNYFTVDVVRLHAAEFCKQHLLCPLCAIRRGAKLLKSYLDAFQFVQAKQPHLVPYMVTFTVKNGDDLKERMQHLRKSLQFLHKRRHRPRDVSEVKKAQAGVWSFEVTNKGNGWHPHCHAVWLCSSEPDQDALRQEWKDITGDSFMVDVRPFTGEPVEAFCEVFKYAVKFSELSPEHTWEAYKVLQGSRLVASFGDFYGVEVPDEYTDAPLAEDLPYIDMLYRWVADHYSFVDIAKEQKPGGNPNLKVPQRNAPDRATFKENAIKRNKGQMRDAYGRTYLYSFLPDFEDPPEGRSKDG